jgi:hypothetical protein
MTSPSQLKWIELGIERVAAVDESAVARVDVMTRSQSHAALLESTFGVRPFRFTRGNSLVHAFARLPAVAVRKWLEARSLVFAVTPGGLRQDGPLTWVQGGFPL